MSSQRNPFDEIEEFFERMGQQFEEASSAWQSDDSLGRWMPGRESMAMDLVEHDDKLIATVDLPGFERDEVDVRVTNHTLHVEAEHEEETDEEHETESGRFLRRERRHAATQRSLRLPEEVETDDVDAQMKNGVLTITLPKTEAEQARTIEIE